MLYVFQVDIGVMMTFEMRLAMDTVSNLKRAITMKTEIPEDKQVLLISGGESLNNMHKVCSYSSAGTDTSPIFLFAKINIESNQPPALETEYGEDIDMMEMIESCMSMQPSLDTLVARTELAVALNEQAARQKETCERLVHDQHLQQQGWAAVTANLEDLTRAFRHKSEMLLTACSEFTKCKTDYTELLQKFQDDIKRLDDIPILPTLIEGNKFPSSTRLAASATSVNFPSGQKRYTDTQNRKMISPEKTECTTSDARATSSVTEEEPQYELDEDTQSEPDKKTANNEETKQSEDEYQDAEQEAEKLTTTSSSQGPPPSNVSSEDQASVTLRQWIDYHDSQNSLERLADLCWRGLERFNESNAEQIHLEVQELLKSINNGSMKEIKGLEERLFGLEKLMADAKKVVEEQSQLAASFQNNRERFSKIKDSTLLPDLSASHKQQLQMMLTNHKKMNDYRNRCAKAKHELSANLHARLKWIMFIEQQMSDLDGKLMIYKKNLLRLNRHFEIVEQVYKAPDLYLASVVEALRRRRFSRRYLHWANTIAKISKELYDNEVRIRKEFDEKLGSHFLSNLFPGLTRSYPPSFATKEPDPFDTKLPRITAADIQYLQTNLSDDLAKNLYIPKDVPMPHLTPDVELDDCCEDRHSSNPTPPSSPMRDS